MSSGSSRLTKLSKPEGGVVIRARRNKTLTPELIDVLERSIIQHRMPIGMACDLVGFSDKTLRRWIAEGMEEDCTDPLKQELAERLTVAKATAVKPFFETFQEHAAVDPRACRELLGFMDPDRFTPQTKTKIEATVTPKTNLDGLRNLSEEELAEFERQEEWRAKKLGGGE